MTRLRQALALPLIAGIWVAVQIVRVLDDVALAMDDIWSDQ